MKKPLLLIAAVCLAGCSTFNTTQTDKSYELQPGKTGTNITFREITTKATARTFWDARSALANFKATQTDKTQSATVGALNNESSGTNAVTVLKEIRGIVEALPK